MIKQRIVIYGSYYLLMRIRVLPEISILNFLHLCLCLNRILNFKYALNISTLKVACPQYGIGWHFPLDTHYTSGSNKFVMQVTLRILIFLSPVKIILHYPNLTDIIFLLLKDKELTI
jgi:hypothetical protein